jgi:hypothetical protein
MMRVILTRDLCCCYATNITLPLDRRLLGWDWLLPGGHYAPWNSTSLRLPNGEESIAEVSLTPDVHRLCSRALSFSNTGTGSRVSG